jgi:hypothetical protein
MALHPGVVHPHREPDAARLELVEDVVAGSRAVARDQRQPQRRQRQRDAGVALQEAVGGEGGEDPVPLRRQAAERVHRVDLRHDELDAAVAVLDPATHPDVDAVGQAEAGVLGEDPVDPQPALAEEDGADRRRVPPSGLLAQGEVDVPVGVGWPEPVDLAPHPDLGREGGGDRPVEARGDLADGEGLLLLEERSLVGCGHPPMMAAPCDSHRHAPDGQLAPRGGAGGTRKSPWRDLPVDGRRCDGPPTGVPTTGRPSTPSSTRGSCATSGSWSTARHG